MDLNEEHCQPETTSVLMYFQYFLQSLLDGFCFEKADYILVINCIVSILDFLNRKSCIEISLKLNQVLFIRGRFLFLLSLLYHHIQGKGKLIFIFIHSNYNRPIMSKAFLKVMNDIKRQKTREQKKKQHKRDIEKDLEDDMSSSEEQKLKSLGVFKKKIHKEDEQLDKQWRHDRYKGQREELKQKPARDINPPTIIFDGTPGYNIIFQIIKHLKIFIREIDDKKVVFNQMHAFLDAKRLFVEKGLLFKVIQTTKSVNWK